ncbi:MAG TPA: patatin-like phospholipase RssA [Gammaproteobacteria bacterium]
MTRPRIGLVLGSGSARGWAHIGVIRALEEHGIRPDVVAGSSIGALVGASYASGHLDTLETWVRTMTFWDVVKLLDIRLSGGLIEGESLMESMREQFAGHTIESLPIPFAAVATDLNSGREVWLQKGELRSAIRASIALPGLFSPTQIDHQWLVDGGIVNPVPVSVARAMGAEFIIAVNLNEGILGRHLAPPPDTAAEIVGATEERDLFSQLLERLNAGLRDKAINGWRSGNRQHDPEKGVRPGLFEVMASAINIMQVQITHNRMAGDPPDVVIAPKLSHLGLLEFDRAAEAIQEGYAAVGRVSAALQELR